VENNLDEFFAEKDVIEVVDNMIQYEVSD